jgi:hypothetical protein
MSTAFRTFALAAAACTLLSATSAMAQDLREVTYGHSAAYYGMTSPLEQRASIRAVLSSVQLARLRQAPSVAAAGTYLFLQMFVGGGGAPTDVAESRSTLEGVFERE